MKRSTPKRSKSTKTKRGGNWFQDVGRKIANEFTNPNSVLRKDVLGAVTNVSRVLPIPGLSNVVGAVNMANDAAKSVGLGRKKKYVKYIKSKTHGKRKIK